MRTEKIGSRLIFNLDDGSTVKYDLATKETIGKRGKPVKNLKSQLGQFGIEDIIDSIENEAYREFLRFVRREYPTNIFNFGTLLEKSKDYSHFEQYYTSGICNFDRSLRVHFSDIPKGVIKFVRETGFKLTATLIRLYTKYPNEFALFMSNEYVTLAPSDFVKLMEAGYYREGYKPTVIHLVENNNYNFKALLAYIDNIMSYEALDSLETVRNLQDYVRMMEKLSPKFEKYPRYLRTTHDIAVRNYNSLNQKFDEAQFETTVRKDLDYKGADYVFICARTPQDIKDEAVQQNNCVASYIKFVLEGKCHIVLMRKKDFKDRSVVTLEIRNGKVVQAKGRHNRELTEKEREGLDKYKAYLKKIEEEKSNDSIL